MITTGPTLLSRVEVFAKPFPYFVCPQAFSNEFSLNLLEWLETDAPWKLVESDFYEQFEFSFLDVQLPEKLSLVLDPSFLNTMRLRLEQLFNVSLAGRIDSIAHRLEPGQRVRIHNDFIPGGETHRVVIQLNRGRRDEDGGLLMLFNSSNPADVHTAFRPLHNSAVGLAISPDSNHAVSTIHGGERFTLVYSFYQSSASL